LGGRGRRKRKGIFPGLRKPLAEGLSRTRDVGWDGEFRETELSSNFTYFRSKEKRGVEGDTGCEWRERRVKKKGDPYGPRPVRERASEEKKEYADNRGRKRKSNLGKENRV